MIFFIKYIRTTSRIISHKMCGQLILLDVCKILVHLLRTIKHIVLYSFWFLQKDKCKLIFVKEF